jgi:hypothetical protein
MQHRIRKSMFLICLREGHHVKKLAGFVVLALAFLPTQTWGQTSQQYALMGKKLWAAFACAATTDVIGEEAEENRLFKIGYEQGTIFLDAVQSGKVEQKDLFVLKGPSVDFHPWTYLGGRDRRSDKRHFGRTRQGIAKNCGSEKVFTNELQLDVMSDVA